MPQHVHFFWGRHIGRSKLNLQWDAIHHDSVVVITASEGQPPITTGAPVRFVGDANFTVSNVAPHDRGVTFVVNIDFFEPLNLWTTITVFDRSDFTGMGSVRFPPPR